MARHITKRDEFGHTWHYYLNQIATLKQQLKDMDYLTIKYIEGQLSEAVFEGVVTEKAQLRNQINELEEKVIKIQSEEEELNK